MRHTLTKGFTVAELIIVMVVAGLLLPLIIGPLDDLYTSFIRSTKSVVQIGDAHGALRMLEDDISFATTLNPTRSVSAPLGANNDATAWDWRGDGPDSRVIIITAYATTASRNDNSRTLAFATNCTTPLTNTHIYFVDDGTLYRRTIASTQPQCASTPIAQKTTCAAGVTGSSCQGADAVIIRNVTKFSVDYYSDPSSPTPVAGQYDDDSLAPTVAKTVVINLWVSEKSGQSDITSKRTLRVTRMNEG